MAVLQIFVYLVKAQSHMISSNPTQFEKDKYTDQIKVSIMFFGNSIRFLKLVGLIVNNLERINIGKRNKINIVQCSKS